MNKYPKRGDIFWVNLDPTVGTEIKKKRPAVIISNNCGNEVSSRVIVAPITSSVRQVFPFEVKVAIKERSGKILLDQIRAIDKQRLSGKITVLDLETMNLVNRALKLTLALD